MTIHAKTPSSPSPIPLGLLSVSKQQQSKKEKEQSLLWCVKETLTLSLHTSKYGTSLALRTDDMRLHFDMMKPLCSIT